MSESKLNTFLNYSLRACNSFFLLQHQVACGHKNVLPGSSLAVSYSIAYSVSYCKVLMKFFFIFYDFCYLVGRFSFCFCIWVAGMDKFLSMRPIFWARNFNCALDPARKEMGTQHRCTLLIETQIEKLLLVLYYLQERNCLRDKFSRFSWVLAKFAKSNPRGVENWGIYPDELRLIFQRFGTSCTIIMNNLSCLWNPFQVI